MKNILLSVCLLMPFGIYAQDSQKAAKALVHKHTEPVYYINGKKFDNALQISPDAIESMEVKSHQNPPAIYIRTKPGHGTFYSFRELLKKFNLPEAEAISALIVLDGKIIAKQNQLLVDSAEISSVKLTTLKKLDYLPENFKSMKVIDIQLKQPNRIRGLALNGE